MTSDSQTESGGVVSSTALLASDNFRYIITFLANSGERTRAIRLVMDATGWDSKQAEAWLKNAWREWRKKHPLIAG